MRDRGWILFGFLLSVVTAAPQSGVTVDEQTVDVSEILHDLFIYNREGRELDEDVGDIEVADVTEDVDAAEEDAQTKTDEAAVAESEAVDIERFNNYIDAIYRRMNAALRAKMMDPMQINLDQKLSSKKKDDDKEEMPRVRRDAGEEEELEDDDDAELVEEVEIDHRIGKGKKGKKEKKGTGVKKGKGNKGKKGKKKEEREAAKKEKQQKKAKKQKDREEKRKQKQNKKKGDRESRSGDKKRRKKGSRKNKKAELSKDSKKNSKAHQKNNKGNEKNSKGKKSNKSRSSHAAKSRQSNQDKMLGSLSGIATLRRDGDVAVTVEDNHKVIKSSFNVGPLQLEVSKVSGKGKARTIRSAKAVTDVMKGTMTIKVKPDGSAHVKKVVFQEPENVDVKGSLNDNKTRNLRNMRRTVSKMRPLAALRVLKTARYVLKSPSSY